MNIEFLEEILNTPSPSGYTYKVLEIVEEKLNSFGVATSRTAKGALVGTIEGRDTSRVISLAAHVDTLGLMVKEIKANGRIKASRIGGFSFQSVENEYVTIHTMEEGDYRGTMLNTKASVHVHGDKHESNARDEENMEIRLDEVVESAQDVRDLGINIGDFISIDNRYEHLDSGYIKSRHLDDKVCVHVLLMLAEYFAANQPPVTLHFFISNYEEVGHGASAGLPENTEELICLDMAAPGEGQESHESYCTICAMDSTGPYDFELRNRLIDVAREHELRYKVDIYPHYGSDGSAALRAGGNFKVALIGPGVDASHGMERTHMDGIQSTFYLCQHYILSKGE